MCNKNKTDEQVFDEYVICALQALIQLEGNSPSIDVKMGKITEAQRAEKIVDAAFRYAKYSVEKRKEYFQKMEREPVKSDYPNLSCSQNDKM